MPTVFNFEHLPPQIKSRRKAPNNDMCMMSPESIASQPAVFDQLCIEKYVRALETRMESVLYVQDCLMSVGFSTNTFILE